MTHWLKIRFSTLIGGALLIGGATFLHAQNDYPAPAKTPEEAGAMFYQLLSYIKPLGQNNPNDPSPARFLGALSRRQMQGVPLGGRQSDFNELLLILAKERDEPQVEFDTQVVSRNGEQSFVTVAPVKTPKPREIVVVPEDGGFRVDLKATYGRWNNLSGQVLDERWFHFTGILLPGLTGTPFSSNALEESRRRSCQSNMKQQMLGVLQYAQDYDERLPPASKWVDVLQPYLKSEQVFQCPSLTATTNGESFGYAFNQNLSQINERRIQEPSLTATIYETSNPARNWFGSGTGRAYRHASGSNLAFADGHIKWFPKGLENGVTFKP